MLNRTDDIHRGKGFGAHASVNDIVGGDAKRPEELIENNREHRLDDLTDKAQIEIGQLTQRGSDRHFPDIDIGNQTNTFQPARNDGCDRRALNTHLRQTKFPKDQRIRKERADQQRRHADHGRYLDIASGAHHESITGCNGKEEKGPRKGADVFKAQGNDCCVFCVDAQDLGGDQLRQRKEDQAC